MMATIYVKKKKRLWGLLKPMTIYVIAPDSESDIVPKDDNFYFYINSGEVEVLPDGTEIHRNCKVEIDER